MTVKEGEGGGRVETARDGGVEGCALRAREGGEGRKGWAGEMIKATRVLQVPRCMRMKGEEGKRDHQT